MTELNYQHSLYTKKSAAVDKPRDAFVQYEMAWLTSETRRK